jgi:hypothetical protein
MFTPTLSSGPDQDMTSVDVGQEMASIAVSTLVATSCGSGA